MALEQGSAHRTVADTVQEMLQLCSQAHGVILGDSAVQDYELDLILVGLFQLRTFYDATVL